MHIVYGQTKELPKRVAVRGILRRGNELGIIKVEKYDCLIFPGGGVDEGEELIPALKREMLEETGFNVHVKNHILTTETAEVDFIHVNHYYECEIIGEANSVALTELEVELGIEFEWRNINDLYKYYMNNEDDLRYGEHNKIVQHSIKSRGFLFLNKYLNEEENYLNLLKNWIGKNVEVTVDRPIGYKHKSGIFYTVNYGYINNIFSLDGEELDAYVLGEENELSTFNGKVIGVVYREDDVEEKLIVSNKDYSIDEIKNKVNFIEKYFKSIIVK
ncbi:NUDIX domain-containing protein [Mycoplasmatota bacterium WC44]